MIQSDSYFWNGMPTPHVFGMIQSDKCFLNGMPTTNQYSFFIFGLFHAEARLGKLYFPRRMYLSGRMSIGPEDA